MEVRTIEFQFKGARDYVHGTDMFNAMLDAGKASDEAKNIRFSMHDFVRGPKCQLHLADSIKALSPIKNISARCQFDVKGATQWLALTQGDDATTSATHYEYDEAGIISACRMQEDGIVLVQPSPYSFIETIVAMSKHMHQQLFPQAVGRWIFTRIDLAAACNTRNKLALQIKHNMNFRLTKSDILVDSKKVGDLYFSLVTS